MTTVRHILPFNIKQFFDLILQTNLLSKTRFETRHLHKRKWQHRNYNRKEAIFHLLIHHIPKNQYWKIYNQIYFPTLRHLSANYKFEAKSIQLKATVEELQQFFQLTPIAKLEFYPISKLFQ
ncbi:hypothetical protein T07_1073 [Trichinella nelsoni]|uniref:Uncharacterized protein n=1 Tax=Trichinella nelsoni TaxID=6336 RepID=A0A0V0RI47_9BILA|nr:hypothetical protein T07_1073 [Trichinella nelsoni]